MYDMNTAIPGVNRGGNAMLCLFSGETPRPVAVLCFTRNDLIAAIREHLSFNASDVVAYLTGISKHDFHDRNMLQFEFEIGTASFFDVLFFKTG